VKLSDLREIEQRLTLVEDLLDNPERLSRLIKRLDPELRGTDVKDTFEALVSLVQEDVPAMIREIKLEKKQTNRLQTKLMEARAGN
jgi:hypothetical protein